MCVCVRECVRVPGRVAFAWACLFSMQCAILWRHLWPLNLHHIFQHYLINGTIFGKKITERKICILILSSTFIWNISRSTNTLARYCHKCKNVFMRSTRYLCRILMKLEFSRHIFEKVWNIKFNKNPSIGSRVVPCGQTYSQIDRRTWQS